MDDGPRFEIGERVWYRPVCPCEYCQRHTNKQMTIDSRQRCDGFVMYHACKEPPEQYLAWGWYYMINDNDFCASEADLQPLGPDDAVILRVADDTVVIDG